MTIPRQWSNRAPVYTAEQLAIERASFGWEKTSHRAQPKVICPACGAKGYPGCTWTHRHLDHFTAPCGKVVTSIPQHSPRCALCKEIT